MTRLYCYVETFDHGEWVETLTLRGEPSKVRSCVLKPKLHGVLAMGVSRSFPFSFGQRGLPHNVSDNIFQMYHNTPKSTGPSYLSLAELQHKAVELLVSPHGDALSVRKILNDFISYIPKHEGNLEYQRIVFWFV